MIHMERLTILTLAAALTAVGCAAPMSEVETARAPDPACGAPVAHTHATYTVEGFGGPGETQLMMTRRQAERPCVSRDGAMTGGATLAANE